MSRGQTQLPALAIALLVLTTVAGLGIALGEGAFAATDREPGQRRVAVALSERLVSEESPLTARANVVNQTRIENLSIERLRSQYPVIGDRPVRVRLGERTVAESNSSISGGTTIRRIVLVSERQSRQYEPPFTGGNKTTLPRRTETVRLRIDPPARTAVETVRANERVVLQNVTGLRGTFTVDTSRFETTRLAFEANRTLSRGDVRVTSVPERTTKATLAVTVGD